MALPTSIKVVEVCEVPPDSGSPESAKELRLPFTFLDIYWLKFPPVERIFFFKLTQSTPQFFTSVILPKLKHSLSLTLLRFLPLAGRLIWPAESPTPVILYTPSDGVPLTVAQSEADLDLLLSSEMIEATESRPYVPELPVSETVSSIITLQVTLFPNKGFTIGISSHHAALDGKSSTMFVKAWAYTCKHGYSTSLLPELTPVYDRNGIKDPSDLETVLLSIWTDLAGPEFEKNPKSLRVLSSVSIDTDVVRSTFELNPEEINKLRNKVLLELRISSVHFSAFVITCAYVSVCMVKARGGDENRKVRFVFTADCRSRLDPPLPINYLGNCVASHELNAEARDFMQENGISVIAERISGMIKGLEKGPLEGAEDTLSKLKYSLEGLQGISVAGSPRFEVYGCDFGWGKPKKVEITSIDRTGAMSLNETRDGNGGVEIGLALPRHEMEAFSSMFVNGLKDL